MIDVKGVLDELGIDYKEDGKNVGRADLNIDCPFCGSDKHLGINRGNGYTNCWVCGFSDLDKWPSLAKVLVETTGQPWKEILNALNHHGYQEKDSRSESESKLARYCCLPDGCVDFTRSDLPEVNGAFRYLYKRGFDSNHIIKYNLRVCLSGRYGQRVIIPVYKNEKLVTFTGRDYTGEQEERYKHGSIFMSSERIKNTLYNYDTAKNHEHIFLLEGPTDVWAIGDDSVAVFKSKLSASQRKLIVGMRAKKITIVFDPDAISRAYETAEMLSPFMQCIKVVKLPKGKDAAELGRAAVEKTTVMSPYYRQ